MGLVPSLPRLAAASPGAGCGAFVGADVLMAAWSHIKGSPPGYIPCGTPHRSRHWVLKAQWIHLIFVNVRTENDVKIIAIRYVIKSVKYRCAFLFSYIFLKLSYPTHHMSINPTKFMAT